LYPFPGVVERDSILLPPSFPPHSFLFFFERGRVPPRPESPSRDQNVVGISSYQTAVPFCLSFQRLARVTLFFRAVKSTPFFMRCLSLRPAQSSVVIRRTFPWVIPQEERIVFCLGRRLLLPGAPFSRKPRSPSPFSYFLFPRNIPFLRRDSASRGARGTPLSSPGFSRSFADDVISGRRDPCTEDREAAPPADPLRETKSRPSFKGGQSVSPTKPFSNFTFLFKPDSDSNRCWPQGSLFRPAAALFFLARRPRRIPLFLKPMALSCCELSSACRPSLFSEIRIFILHPGPPDSLLSLLLF